eukprot:GHVQ01026471.1.p1 GENE.GHVQ01026471.1~~GHVQ01026471.1.p1  ORF type:complete len:636 (+),score=108.47 GHVQ01026471.1:72-1910(+)
MIHTLYIYYTYIIHILYIHYTYMIQILYTSYTHIIHSLCICIYYTAHCERRISIMKSDMTTAATLSHTATVPRMVRIVPVVLLCMVMYLVTATNAMQRSEEVHLQVDRLSSQGSAKGGMNTLSSIVPSLRNHVVDSFTRVVGTAASDYTLVPMPSDSKLLDERIATKGSPKPSSPSWYNPSYPSMFLRHAKSSIQGVAGIGVPNTRTSDSSKLKGIAEEEEIAKSSDLQLSIIRSGVDDKNNAGPSVVEYADGGGGDDGSVDGGDGGGGEDGGCVGGDGGGGGGGSGGGGGGGVGADSGGVVAGGGAGGGGGGRGCKRGSSRAKFVQLVELVKASTLAENRCERCGNLKQVPVPPVVSKERGGVSVSVTPSLTEMITAASMTQQQIKTKLAEIQALLEDEAQASGEFGRMRKASFPDDDQEYMTEDACLDAIKSTLHQLCCIQFVLRGVINGLTVDRTRRPHAMAQQLIAQSQKARTVARQSAITDRDRVRNYAKAARVCSKRGWIRDVAFSIFGLALGLFGNHGFLYLVADCSTNGSSTSTTLANWTAASTAMYDGSSTMYDDNSTMYDDNSTMYDDNSTMYNASTAPTGFSSLQTSLHSLLGDSMKATLP